MREPKMGEPKNSGLAFHVHHNELIEWCYDYKRRVEVIKKTKPLREQELRLRLFKLIPDELLPPELVKAWEAEGKAREVRDKAWETWGIARKVRDKAYEAWGIAYEAWSMAYKVVDPQLEALHKELCPNCPWNGKTIFPKEE